MIENMRVINKNLVVVLSLCVKKKKILAVKQWVVKSKMKWKFNLKGAKFIKQSPENKLLIFLGNGDVIVLFPPKWPELDQNKIEGNRFVEKG